MITSTRDHFFKKRFSKLDFLKTALVTITANSEKMKMKKLQLLLTFTFLYLPSFFNWLSLSFF